MGWNEEASANDRQEWKRIQANGLSFHLLDAGDGSSVMLLHGFPDTARLWRNQIPDLVEAGYRVIAPDLRGRGETDAPEREENYHSRFSSPTCWGSWTGFKSKKLRWWGTTGARHWLGFWQR